MTHDQLSTLIVNESEDLIYLSDIDDYQLIYLSPAALRQLDMDIHDQSYKEKKCYEVLQGRTAPCDFCTNKHLSEDHFYTWQIYNSKLDGHYSLKDKLVRMDGRLIRMEIAVDITREVLEKQHLKSRLTIEETLIRCIQTLSQNSDTKAAINSLLAILADFYSGERGYIFEFDYENEIIYNTYEWCREGITPQIDMLQHVPFSVVSRWLKYFETTGEFYIDSVEETIEKGTLEHDILVKHKIDCLVAAPLISDEKIVGFIGVDNPKCNTSDLTLLKSVSCFVLEDIDKRRLMAQLQHMSYTDMLTGLMNRNKYISKLLDMELNPPETAGVVYVDINGLKEFNDTKGHTYGDFMIRETARLLEHIFPGSTFRIGGDEFIVVCENILQDEFEEKVTTLRNAAGNNKTLKISIGASWASGTKSVKEQVNHADKLMYIEKQSYYHSMTTGKYHYRAELAKNLIAAIDRGEFVVFLQPKVELKNGKLHGAEALIRRIDTDGKIIPPDQFIPEYESENIIRHIDLYVLKTVCQTLKHWKDEGHPLIRISVNFSRISLMEHDIVDLIANTCREYGIDPTYIDIEVTESVSKMKPELLKQLVQEIALAGFSISLDDFGAEYSNLAILTSMNFNELKLDKSLVNNIEFNRKSRIVVEHTIDMCRALETTTSIAEGIETEEQKDILHNANCDYGQGYFFSKPIPIEDFYNKYIRDSDRESQSPQQHC